MNSSIIKILNLYALTYGEVYNRALGLHDCNDLVKITDDLYNNSFKVFHHIKITPLKGSNKKVTIANGPWYGTFHESDYGVSWFILNRDIFIEQFGSGLANI